MHISFENNKGLSSYRGACENTWSGLDKLPTILPGVTIGEGAVIAAGAVVTRTWNCIYGIPAVKIGSETGI